MSGWGDKDDVTSPGTVTVSGLNVSNGTGSSTFFSNNYIVGQVITIGGFGSATILAIANNTRMTLASNTELTTATITNAQHTISEKPIYIIETDPTILGNTVFGVSTAEQTVDVTNQQSSTKNNRQIANTAAHAGWVKLGDIYTDSNGNVRRKNETLVAMSTITGDAADDTTLPDA